jgi:ABC-type lipoprotein export system ATPase subunit
VVVAGESLGALDEDALARFRGRNVGIVFQSFHLIPTMTALENVAVPLELAGLADAQRALRAKWLPSGCPNGTTDPRSFPAASSSASRWRLRPTPPS